ncbi:MAG TPA: hypothetical protein VL403_00440 [Candidatus Kryptonia bacterium]|nr:hypothetical protein [Candidatus Kryptonia bacterium]
MNSDVLIGALDNEIRSTHERFLAAMDQRLPGLQPEIKERYFAVLSTLVAKLEEPHKSLHDVLQEMMSEVASYLFEEMSRRG